MKSIESNKMPVKRLACLWLAFLLLHAQGAKTQENGAAETSHSSIQIPRSAVEQLANVTDEANLWILLPANLSDGRLNRAEFSLFKLNTGQLDDPRATDLASESGGWIGADPDSGTGQQAGLDQTAPIFRDGRKMNLFSNVLNKPKVSPLYLVNGTVCRFVNSQPICTTLSTTGLFRGQTPFQSGGGFFQQQQQGNNNFNNPLQNQRQVSPNSQGFLQNSQGFPPNSQGFNNQNNFQQFRPAALLEADSQELNVEASNSSLKSSAKQVPARQQAVNLAHATRPHNFLANRRPLNLLSFGRPFRNQYQRRRREDSSALGSERKAA